jgi:hypothetical protein
MPDQPTIQPDGFTTKPPHCVLCKTTRGPFDDEDVLAKWITRILPKPTTAIHRGSDDSRARPHRSNVLEAKARKAVCKTCNNGWMNALEQKVKTIVSGAMNPTPETVPVRLNREQQRTLAFWAIEKALFLELSLRQSKHGYKRGHLPADHFTWLFDHRDEREPPSRHGRAPWAFSRTTTPTCGAPTVPTRRTRPGSARARSA